MFRNQESAIFKIFVNDGIDLNDYNIDRTNQLENFDDFYAQLNRSVDFYHSLELNNFIVNDTSVTPSL